MNLFLALVLSLSLAAPVRIVSQGAGRARVVTLTFDAGADRGYAARILATLERYHLHASFGMTGRWALHNRDLLRRMARDGDTFINHTYDHRSFTGYSTKTAPLTEAQRTWEIEQTWRVVKRLTGRSIKPYFRPPYGDYDQATLRLLPRLGYHDMIMWTIDSLGWEGLPSSLIVRRCLTLARPGAILLMHVGIQSQDGLALPRVIQGLRARGYRIVTLKQLLRQR